MIHDVSERKARESAYSMRSLEEHSRTNLYAWLNDQHVPNPIAPESLHCSVVCACSDLPSDYQPDRRRVSIEPVTYHLGVIGPAFALFFDCDILVRQWRDAVEHGVHMVYNEYIPHISLTYKVDPTWNYRTIQPPSFSLALDGEVVSAFDPKFASRT